MLDLSFSIISPVLLFVATLVTALKGQWHRVACAFSIILPTYVHYKYFDNADGWVYYGTAFSASAITLALLQLVKPNKQHSQLVVHLQVISICLMIINLLGYVMWYTYLPPQWYNAFVLAFALAEVVRLFLHTDGDRKDGTDGVYYSWISRHNDSNLGSRG